MVPIHEVSGHSSVELIDSCNCNQCCPRNCCFPWRVKQRTPHVKPKHENPEVNPDAFTRTHTVSMPVLTDTGKWQVEIDGVKHSLSENAIGDAIKKEHGIPK